MNKCNICNSLNFIDEHHITSRSKDGTNDKWNIAKLCSNCHRRVHEGSIIIEGFFLTTSGRKLIWRESKDGTITNNQPSVHLIKRK